VQRRHLHGRIQRCSTALFERGSREHLAECLQALLGDDNLRKALSAAGLMRAKDFSWQRCAEQTVGIYGIVSDLVKS